jgi:dienelactone hydrolase
MFSDSRLSETEQLGHLGGGPLEPEHQEHADPLSVRHGRDRRNQVGFDNRLIERRWLIDEPGFLASGPALPDPVQVTGRVRKTPYSIPVLPGIGESFGGRLATTLVAIGRSKGASESWLYLGHEDPEPVLAVSVDQSSPLPRFGLLSPPYRYRASRPGFSRQGSRAEGDPCLKEAETRCLSQGGRGATGPCSMRSPIKARCDKERWGMNVIGSNSTSTAWTQPARARRVTSTVVALVALGVVGSLASACTSSPSAPKAVVSYTNLAGPGPYAAGTVQFDVGGDAVVVWYPATKASVATLQRYTYHLRTWTPAIIQKLVPSSFPDGVTEDAYRGVPAASGSFPVVLFSHGYGGYPEQSTFLTAHLATWGMIVVAPDQLSRDLSAEIDGKATEAAPPADVTEQLAALAYVKKLGTTPGSLLYGHVNSAKVATLGHSAGGGTAVRVAAADPSIRGWIALAGVPAPQPATPVPSLMISGSLDKTVPTAQVRTFYGSVRGDKALIVINGYGHNVFDDVCTINRAHGGVVGAVQELHLPVPPAIVQLGTDGCEPPDAYPPTAWPLIDQAVTAQLRFDFGVTSSVVGLGAGIDSAFSGVHAQFTSSP